MLLEKSLFKTTFFALSLVSILLAACKHDPKTPNGKSLGQSKAKPEIVSTGEKMHQNMQGTWKANENGRSVELNGEMFKMTENGKVILEGKFLMYKVCPDFCFGNPNLSSTGPCFSIAEPNTGDIIECFSLQGLKDGVLAFASLTKIDEKSERPLLVQTFTKQ